MTNCEACGDPVELAPGCGIGACPHRFPASSTPAPDSAAPSAAIPRPGGDPATFAPPLRRLIASGPEYALALCFEALGFFLGPLGPVVSLSLAVYFAVRDQDDSRLSFGKRLTHLRVVDNQTGALATPRQAVLRNLPFVVGFVLAVVPGVEFLGWGMLLLAAALEGVTSLFDPAGRRWGDRLAGTRVVGVDER